MSVFTGIKAEPEVDRSPIDLARVALEAIDVTPHVERRDSLKRSIDAKKAALERAQERLQSVNERIRDKREPDGVSIALALMEGADLPPPPTALEEEKEQLLLGIRELNRQVNDAHLLLRRPWDGLKKEITEAMAPVVHDIELQAQEITESIELLYAKTEALRRIVQTGPIDGVWQLMGELVIATRESRYVNSRVRFPVDPEILALNPLEPFKAMQARIPDEIDTPNPSWLRL
ncbi:MULTISPECIES: hypothetical protein [unclassified Sphingobium]|uniref:hypothetical protein n=1 Tax=unclassified Sphingobium TaxID=2611147 RepID=UPI000D16B133|nr:MULTISPECIES: hypothetical protein [unclassified Sphingobium]PSO12614.1 hypothetical protein C7E20_05765 [Sphingobium sp. AEW4]TWD09793.1 hypothetical protein FB595_104140 [Sphingobium sp. AEW010]TWD26464.1 hypothetical protein FB596_104140 [Sphingobium sp. AEW013]TWD27767.1 hypothetical protein FB594_105188 [Sphingobium sp. AEW001]